jgi:hypothetical protein
MASVKKTQKYIKCSQFVDEMIANGIFDKLGTERIIEWEVEDKNLFWRITNLTGDNDPFTEYTVSCQSNPVCKTKKKYDNKIVRKGCWIYKGHFETDDRYKFIINGYCITGIQTK